MPYDKTIIFNIEKYSGKGKALFPGKPADLLAGAGLTEGEIHAFEGIRKSCNSKEIRIRAKYPEGGVFIISVTDSTSQIRDAFCEATSSSRIYLCGHGHEGLGGGDSKMFAGWEVEELIDQLRKVYGMKSAGRIVLAGCYSKNFAREFHRRLGSGLDGIRCEVAGYSVLRITIRPSSTGKARPDTGKTAVVTEENGERIDRYLRVPKQKGSLETKINPNLLHLSPKSVFSWDGDDQKERFG